MPGYFVERDGFTRQVGRGYHLPQQLAGHGLGLDPDRGGIGVADDVGGEPVERL